MINAGIPFAIDGLTTKVFSDPDIFRRDFDSCPILLFEDVIAPSFLQSLMSRAAVAEFVDDDVEHIGTRAVESPQRVGGMLNLVLARQNLLDWLERATGTGPLRAVEGRLVQTRHNGSDALSWHDDMSDPRRRIAVVINLSIDSFDGGMFEMRHVGDAKPFLSYRHQKPGSMMLFAVRRGLEHRVTEIISGGPRRVFAGWFMTEAEHVF
jgi:hypothetical protein